MNKVTVYASHGVTTEYVSVADHEAELAKVREECNWQWYNDHVGAFERRAAEANNQIEMLRAASTSLQEKLRAADIREKGLQHEVAMLLHGQHPLQPDRTFKCPCGAVCSSRDNLLSHIRTEAEFRSNVTLQFRELHLQAAAAFDTLYPA